MKTFNYAVAWVLGLALVFFGLNGFFQFIAAEPTEIWLPFFEGIMSTSYIIPFQSAALILVGLLLLIGKAVPFALLLLAPFTLNWVLLHAFLEPSTLLIPVVIIVLHLYLAYTKWASFKPLFK